MLGVNYHSRYSFFNTSLVLGCQFAVYLLGVLRQVVSTAGSNLDLAEGWNRGLPVWPLSRSVDSEKTGKGTQSVRSPKKVRVESLKVKTLSRL